MQGTLFKYGLTATQLAFKCGNHNKHVVLVGGLSDGLLYAPYAPALAKALDAIGWSLVQAQLSSSYLGFGIASVDQDAAELLLLSEELKRNHRCQGVVIMGTSTGCQDAVRFAKLHQDGPDTPPLLGIVLQAPVSDREWLAQYPELATVAEAAELMVAQGRSEDVLFRFHLVESAPICARRFLSLYQKGGDDDMFSSDLSDAELRELLGHLAGIPTLLLVSGADEYVPSSVDATYQAQRMAAVIGAAAQVVVVPGANHNLSTDISGEGVSHAVRFVKQLQWRRLLKQWGRSSASPSTLPTTLIKQESGRQNPPPAAMMMAAPQPQLQPLAMLQQPQLPAAHPHGVQNSAMTLHALLNSCSTQQQQQQQQHPALSMHLDSPGSGSGMPAPSVSTPLQLSEAAGNHMMGGHMHHMLADMPHMPGLPNIIGDPGMAPGGSHRQQLHAGGMSQHAQHAQHIVGPDGSQHPHQAMAAMQHHMPNGSGAGGLQHSLSDGMAQHHPGMQRMVPDMGGHQGMVGMVSDPGQHHGMAAMQQRMEHQAGQHPGQGLQILIGDGVRHQHMMGEGTAGLQQPGPVRHQHMMGEGTTGLQQPGPVRHQHMMGEGTTGLQQPGSGSASLYHTGSSQASMMDPRTAQQGASQAYHGGMGMHGGRTMLVNHQGHLAQGPISMQMPGSYPGMVPILPYGGSAASPTMTELLYDNPMSPSSMHSGGMMQQPQLHSTHSGLGAMMQQHAQQGGAPGSMVNTTMMHQQQQQQQQQQIHASPNSLDNSPLGSPLGQTPGTAAAGGSVAASHNVASFLISTPMPSPSQHMDHLLQDVLVGGPGGLMSQPSVSQFLDLQSTFNSHGGVGGYSN